MAATYAKMLDNVEKMMGNGLLWTLLLICLLFLLLKMEKSPSKSLLVYFPILILLIYFNPAWFLYFKVRNDGDILYRLLWLIPFALVVCYTLVTVINRLSGKYRFLGFAAGILLVALCGDYVYDNPGFGKAENLYHVSSEVVEICDEINVPGREIKACFPDELVGMVRQYNAFIVLTYGRDSLLEGWMREPSAAYGLMNSDVIDAEKLCDELRATNTAYVVIPSDKTIKGSMAEYDFYYVTTKGRYDIYLDNQAYIGLVSNEENE